MAVFFIAYDLDKPGQNYAAVHKLLKKWGAKRVLESTWVVRMDSSASKILESMNGEKDAFDSNDRIVVIEEADWTSHKSMTPIKEI